MRPWGHGMNETQVCLLPLDPQDWFVSTIPAVDRPWVDDFMSTQMFSTHCDDVLRSEFERT